MTMRKERKKIVYITTIKGCWTPFGHFSTVLHTGKNIPMGEKNNQEIKKKKKQSYRIYSPTAVALAYSTSRHHLHFCSVCGPFQHLFIDGLFI